MDITVTRKIEDASLSDDNIIEMLLHDRNIANPEEFLHPTHPREISARSMFPSKSKYDTHLKTLFNLLTKTKAQKKKIVVYTDYDADGITGGSILWETLHMLGYEVMPYVPDRKKEGYGFSKRGIDTIIKLYDPGLIVSVDHGIVGHEEIAYAKGKGIPVVVTDHHTRGKTDPKADAIFHTTKVSGAGVAYFIAREIFLHDGGATSKTRELDHNFENDYLAIAAIGVVADLVPLTGEARSIVKYGIRALSAVEKPGLQQMMKEARIEGKTLSTYEIGFVIAPRLNAFGRLGNALDGLRLLCTSQPARADALAKSAGAVNTLRQNLLRESFQEAEQMVDLTQKILVVQSQQWEEGIIGLIASKLVQKYHRPAIAMTKSEGGVKKGSARSIEGCNITSFLKGLSNETLQVGGHSQAAGFTIEESRSEEFVVSIQKRANETLSDDDIRPRMRVDMSISLSRMTRSFIDKLQSLQPFGVGNTQPLFQSTGTLTKMHIMGKARDHLKIIILDENSGTFECVFFGQGALAANLKTGQEVSIVYSASLNKYNGLERVQGLGKIIQ